MNDPYPVRDFISVEFASHMNPLYPVRDLILVAARRPEFPLMTVPPGIA